jgi:choline monooxygenase
MTIHAAALESVLLPVESANGLPSEAYIDPSWLRAEAQKIFFAGWSGIGFAKDLPEPGMAMPVDFLGQPLVVIRDREGVLRVFENVCRHRGMVLIPEKMRLRGAIRCPYHSWCYGLEGGLRATPHVGGPGQNTHSSINRDELGLQQVRSHVWRDVIFVNLSGDAPPFEEQNADLIERWREFEAPLYHGGAESSFVLDVQTNWKLAVENYSESYHLPWVHPGLNSYSRLEDHYNIVEYGKFSGQGTLVYQPVLDGGGARFPDFDGLSSKWDRAAEYLTVFPNVLLGVHRDHSFAIVLEPKAVDQTVERVEIYYSAPEVTGDEFAALRTRNAELWKSIFEEDILVVEGMQRGRNGALFDGGRFSPVMDEPTHVFHHWVASKLKFAPAEHTVPS